MPEQTTNLKLPIPLGNENVNRQFFLDLIEAIDKGAISEQQLETALDQIAVALTQDYNSTDQKTAISGDAVRRGLETKQNTLRLADNYLAASVLVNAVPDAQGRAYPDGVSLFKVSGSEGGWPAANGYVLTMRAGIGGVQVFYEMYTGTVQSDKTARQWTRSKRDGNGFWQEWGRGLTEVDQTALQNNLTALQTKVDNPRANLVANGTFVYGTVGWTANPATSVSGWRVDRSANEAGFELAYTAATGAGVVFLESIPFPLYASGTYNVSVEFYAEGFATSDFWLELVGVGSSSKVIQAIYCVNTDRWTRRGQDVVIPVGITSGVIRLVVGPNRSTGFKGFKRIQVTAGNGARPYNDLNDGVVAKRVGAFLMEERYIELGQNVPGDGPAFIDFHTSATMTDYNARIIAQNGGNATGAQHARGTLTYLAGSGHFFDAPVFVEGVDLKKLVLDGKAAVRASIIAKNGTVADADGDGVPTHVELAIGVNSIKKSVAGRTYLGLNDVALDGVARTLLSFPAGISFISFSSRLNNDMLYSGSPAPLRLKVGSQYLSFPVRNSPYYPSTYSVVLSGTTIMITAYESVTSYPAVVASASGFDFVNNSVILEVAPVTQGTLRFPAVDVFYG